MICNEMALTVLENLHNKMRKANKTENNSLKCSAGVRCKTGELTLTNKKKKTHVTTLQTTNH